MEDSIRILLSKIGESQATSEMLKADPILQRFHEGKLAAYSEIVRLINELFLKK